MFILGLNEDNSCMGFYKEGIHNNIPLNHLLIDTSLWSYLLNLGKFQIKTKVSLDKTHTYTILDKDIFEKCVEVQEAPEPSRVDILEQENADLLLDRALKDEKIDQLESDLSDLMLEIATIGGE